MYYPKIKRKTLVTCVAYLSIVVLIWLFYKLSHQVLELETLPMDLIVSQYFYNLRNSKLTPILIFISNFGQYGSLLLVLAVTAIMFFQDRNKNFFRILNLLLATLSVSLVTFILKNFVGRIRPEPALQIVPETTFSYPSGHTSTVFTIYPIFAIFILQSNLNNLLKTFLISFCLIFPILVAISRLYLGVHYFSDIIGGFIIANIVIILTVFLVKPHKINQVT